MTESGAFGSHTPLHCVNADDLKRVWGLIRKVVADHGVGVGIDEGMISQQCDPGADLNAVFFRAALLQHLFESGNVTPITATTPIIRHHDKLSASEAPY